MEGPKWPSLIKTYSALRVQTVELIHSIGNLLLMNHGSLREKGRDDDRWSMSSLELQEAQFFAYNED